MTTSEFSVEPPTADDPVREAQRMLAAHPHARVMAINELGLSIPMPVAVPLTSSQEAIEGYTSALELVTNDDIVVVADVWQRARLHGRAQAQVRPNAAPDTTMTLHLLDTRAEYGVFLALLVGDGADHISVDHRDSEALRPRLTISRQTEFGLFTQVDDAMEAILGHTGLVGRISTELVHPEDSAGVIGVWIEMLARPGCSRRLRFRQRHLDGHWVWFEVTLRNLLNDPDEHSVVVEAIDISDEMAAHEYVVAQEYLLRRLTDSLPVGVVQVDAHGRIVHRNPRADQLLGHPDALTIRDLLVDVVEADARTIDEATRAALADVDSDMEISVVHAGQDLRRCQVILRSLPEASGFLFCISDVTEPARLRDQLHHRATYDPLTGCHNRASVLQELNRSLSGGGEAGVAVVFIDLDGFKLVNDRRGHAAGDALLSDIGQCLKAAVRTDDIVGRFGGDEFIVLHADTTSPAQALELAQRISTSLASSFTPEPPNAAVASIGVAWLAGRDADPSSAETLIGWADAAMYRSKACGDGRPVLHGGVPALSAAVG